MRRCVSCTTPSSRHGLTASGSTSCQDGKIFGTNNNAEAFHSVLHRALPPHPHFDVFVETVCELMATTEIEYSAERLRPRGPRKSVAVPFTRISNIVNNFYNDEALALPLDTMLEEIGTILHADARYEDAYDDGPTTCFVGVDASFSSGGVPMEVEEAN